MQGFALFFSVFGVVFLAELPDKTALATLVMATRRRPSAVLLGAAAALALQTGIAIGAGQLISLLPARLVHVLAGVVFVVSAWIMWRRDAETEANGPSDGKDAAGFARSAWMAFLVVFVAEWGDLTQLATAALAARYRAPLVVFAGATLALWTVSGLAVSIGHRARSWLKPHLLQRVAAVAFLIVGAALCLGLL